MDLYSSPELQSARTDSQSAVKDYQDSVVKQSTLPDMLQEVLNKKFSTNNPMYAEREGALKNYMTVAEGAGTSVLPQNNNGMVFSPNEQAGMLAGTRANALAPLTSVNERFGQAYGGIENIISEISNMYSAMVTGKKFNAENKRQSYLDLLEEISAKSQSAQSEREFQEKIRQFNVEQQNKLKGDGSLGDDAIMSILLQALNKPQQEDYAPTEPKPTRIPNVIAGKGPQKNVLYRSPNGQWVWDNDSSDWIPVID